MPGCVFPRIQLKVAPSSESRPFGSGKMSPLNSLQPFTVSHAHAAFHLAYTIVLQKYQFQSLKQRPYEYELPNSRYSMKRVKQWRRDALELIQTEQSKKNGPVAKRKSANQGGVGTSDKGSGRKCTTASTTAKPGNCRLPQYNSKKFLCECPAKTTGGGGNPKCKWSTEAGKINNRRSCFPMLCWASNACPTVSC